MIILKFKPRRRMRFSWILVTFANIFILSRKEFLELSTSIPTERNSHDWLWKKISFVRFWLVFRRRWLLRLLFRLWKIVFCSLFLRRIFCGLFPNPIMQRRSTPLFWTISELSNQKIGISDAIFSSGKNWNFH